MTSKKDSKTSPASEASVLRILLAINFGMFIVATAIGIIAESTSLIASGIDMLADATVYGISLYAVGKSALYERRAANFSGYFQIGLAVVVLAEVIRRYFQGADPSSTLMMTIAFLSLIANVICLVLLAKHRDGKVHMKASWIFSENDLYANVGVILAGFLVYYFRSPIPDLLIGAIISIIVLRGALTILRLAKVP